MATKKKKNPADLTLRNARAINKKIAEHERRIDDLEAVVGKRTKLIPPDVSEDPKTEAHEAAQENA